MTLHEIRNILAIVFRFMNRQDELSIEEYNLLLRISLYDVLKDKIGYRGEPGGAETNQFNEDFLRRYKKPGTITLTTGTGDLPSDYMRLLPDSCHYTSGSTFIKVEKVTEAQWIYYLTHATLAPTAAYPICKIIGNNMMVQPTTIAEVNIVYYKTPDTPVYAVTITNGIQTYDSGSSTELDLDEEFHIDFILKLLEHLSVPVSRENLLSIIQQKKIEQK